MPGKFWAIAALLTLTLCLWGGAHMAVLPEWRPHAIAVSDHQLETTSAALEKLALVKKATEANHRKTEEIIQARSGVIGRPRFGPVLQGYSLRWQPVPTCPRDGRRASGQLCDGLDQYRRRAAAA